MLDSETMKVPSESAKTRWAAQLRDFLPGSLDAHPVLCEIWREGALLLYGSIAHGIEDALSDLDVWLLLRDSTALEIQAAGQDFVEFKVEERAGHVTIHGWREMADRVQGCEMDLIFQLRHATVVLDSGQQAANLIALACQPMRQSVREAMVLHHYVEMRSEHRACDNPMARGDDVAVLLSLTKMIAHALRTVMVLQGEPYPYDKWLYRAAAATPLGKDLAILLDRIIDRLHPSLLRHAENDHTHPLGREVLALRQALAKAIRGQGVDGDWVDHWYLHMTEARDVLRGLRWQECA